MTETTSNTGKTGRPDSRAADSLPRPGAPSEVEAPPPFLKTWRRLYVSVIVYTALLILALYAITRFLNR